MNRRNFLRTCVGGMAVAIAIPVGSAAASVSWIKGPAGYGRGPVSDKEFLQGMKKAMGDDFFPIRSMKLHLLQADDIWMDAPLVSDN